MSTLPHHFISTPVAIIVGLLQMAETARDMY